MRDTHARLAGEAGVLDPDHDRRALGRSARLRGARSRAGAARVAHEGADPEHALVARDREARGSERLPRGRRARARLGRVVPRARRASFPCSRRSSPATIRAALPASPPTSRSRSPPCSPTSTRCSLPGLTHWQSPRFFAYFATTGSEPGVLAELLIAGLNQVGILWRTSPALQELEELTVDWLAPARRPPRRSSRGHIEDTASTGVLAAVIAARTRQPDRRVLVVLGARALGRGRRRRGCSSSSCGRCRRTTSSACGRTCSAPRMPAPSSRRSGRRAWRRVDPVPEIAERCAAAGDVAARRRRLRRIRRRSAPSSAITSPAGSAPTRSA